MDLVQGEYGNARQQPQPVTHPDGAARPLRSAATPSNLSLVLAWPTSVFKAATD